MVVKNGKKGINFSVYGINIMNYWRMGLKIGKSLLFLQYPLSYIAHVDIRR